MGRVKSHLFDLVDDESAIDDGYDDRDPREDWETTSFTPATERQIKRFEFNDDDEAIPF